MVELGNEVVHGQWSAEEVKHSSTWRVLKAVYSVLQSFASRSTGHSAKWFSDNQGVVSSQSRKPHLQDGAIAIFELCFQHGIKLEMDWVPHSLNTQADFLSRIVDYDDWGMNPCIFQAIDASWDPHSVEPLPHPTMLFHPGFVVCFGHWAVKQ